MQFLMADDNDCEIPSVVGKRVEADGRKESLFVIY